LHDSILGSISLFHGWTLGVFSVSSPEILSRLRADSVSSPYPEMFRYTFPEVMSTVRIPTPMMNRVIANYTCTYGFRYEIESRYAPDVRYLKDDKVPEVSAYEQVLGKPDIPMMQATPPKEANGYLKRVIEFQRAHADILWQGQFTDDEGFTFRGQNLVAKGYVSVDRIGILVWNPGDQPASFTVNVPKAELLSASEPEKDRVAPMSELAPNTVRLLVWKKN